MPYPNERRSHSLPDVRRLGTGELREANDQLRSEIEERRQAEERLKILFEQAPVAYYLHDFRGRFVDGNLAAEEMVGYNREELIGQSFFDLNLLPLGQMPKAAGLLAQSILGRATGPTEFVLKRKDGGHVPVDIRTFPVTVQGQNLVLGVAMDIGERKRSQALLLHRNLLLEMLTTLARAVSETLETGPMMDMVAQVACEAISGTSAYVCSWSSEGNQSVVAGEYISPAAAESERISDRGVEYVEDDFIVSFMREPNGYFIDHIDDPDLSPVDREHMLKFGSKSVLGVALHAGERPLGFIEIWESRHRRDFTPEEIELVRAIGRQVGMSIHNAELHEALQQHAQRIEEQQNELESLNRQLRKENAERLKAEQAERQQRILAEALRESAAAIGSTLDKEAVLDRILLSVVKVLPHDAGNIMLVEGGIARVSRAQGYEKYGGGDWIWEAEFEVASTPSLHQMDQEEAPLVIQDTRLYSGWVTVSGGEWIRATSSVPICQDGKVIGFLTLDSATPGRFTADDGQTLKLFADHIAIALRNAGLYEDTRRRWVELKKLWQVGSAVVSELTSGEVLDLIVRSAAELAQADGASICLLGPDGKTRTHIATTGTAKAVLQDRVEGHQEGLHGFVIMTGEPLLVKNMRQDPRSSILGRELGAAEAMVTPLRVKNQIIGTLSAFSSGDELHFSTHDLRILAAFGDYAAMSIHTSRLYHANEQHIAELRKIAEELGAANDHLKKLSKVKDEFVSNVSHELRTPIASLKIHQQLLMKRPDQIGPILETLRRETNQLEQIIEDLLHLSRLDLGLETFDAKAIHLGDLIAETVQDRTRLAESRDLALHLEIDSDLPMLYGDAGLLSQALNTLLTNALSYTPSGGEIVVGAASRTFDGEPWAGFFVRDSGPGIDPSEKEHIFDRFFRGQAGRGSGVPGTGMGLAIAKKIVEQHNGRIAVESQGEQGEGATFFIWLPAAR